jgi:hypothetical protein
METIQIFINPHPSPIPAAGLKMRSIYGTVRMQTGVNTSAIKNSSFIPLLQSDLRSEK